MGEDSCSVRAFSREVCSAVRDAVKSNRVPAAISFFVGMGLVVAYFPAGDSTKSAFEFVANFNQEYGILGSALSTCLFGGVLPSAVQAVRGQLPKPLAGHFVFNVLLWAAIGCVVNRLYFLQEVLFGSGADLATVVQKVAFDQFVFNPVFTPFTTAAFRWRDHSFPLKFWTALKPRAWLLTYCSVLISIWGTWVPGTVVVYCFPAELQVPCFNVILFMFSILLNLISKRTSSGIEATGEAYASDDVSKKALQRAQIAEISETVIEI